MSVRLLASRVMAALSVLACGLVLWCAPALAARGHVFSGAFGEPCLVEPCGAGQFKELSGVAINEATRQVYVLDQGDGRIERFSLAGAYEAQFDGGETPAKAFSFDTIPLPAGIAVDNSCYFRKLSAGECSAADPSNGDVYVTDSGNEVVDKFSPEGLYLGQLQEASGGTAFTFKGTGEPIIDGVGVDANGTVWVYAQAKSSSAGVFDSFTSALANTFISSGNLAPGSEFGKAGFAVDFKGNLYARVVLDGAFVVWKYSGTPKVEQETYYPSLAAPFDADEASAVAVDLSSDEVFVDNIGSVGAFNESGSLEERFGSGVLVDGVGLAASHANESIYVADSATGMVDVFSPEPPSKPTVQGESVSGVTGNSATLGAEINPRGALAEYHFEYGRCATPSTCSSSAYEESVPVPDAPAGADFEVHSVNMHPQDLLAATTYHFRVVVHNSFDSTEPVDGKEQLFTTQIPGGRLALPDGRAWEMVSPPDKHGALIEATESVLQQASVAGNALTYLSRSPTESAPQGYARQVQVLSTRGSDGWSSRDIAPPHEQGTGPAIGAGGEYRFFSSDLSLGILQPFGGFVASSSPSALSPREASEQTAFLRSDYLSNDVNNPCAESCYRPLVTAAPGYANVAGQAFGEEGRCPFRQTICGPAFVGASSDLSHIVLRSSAPLVAGANSSALYEWAGGRLELISLLPKSETPALAPQFGSRNNASRHAVSDDGSRVVWSAESGSENHLYLRGNDQTLQLDAPDPQCLSNGACGGGAAHPLFQAASSDGSTVYFTDTQRLTADSGASEKARDLYECEIVEAAGELMCKLSDLTPSGPGGEAADVQGLVGASDDGSYVYFVANGVFAPGAAPGKCSESSSGATCSLYVRHQGTTRLVAELSSADVPDWKENLSFQTARVSPDGRWLAFMSQRQLTGYDTRDATSGEPDEEVYLYDAAGAGRLACASCNPTGARPFGIQDGGQAGKELLVDSEEKRWGGHRLAANLPGWTSYAGSQAPALQQARYLSNEGRLFFNSSDALAPQDVNGREDVYEYEPPGVGGCTTASLTFSERSRGCVDLISSGASAEESVFMDASETGGDVFFATTAKLASQDFDSAFDVYDAHECASSSPCFPVAAATPPACTTADSCRAAPSPQPSVFGSPSSATFAGAGNLTTAAATPALRTKTLGRAQKLVRALKACRVTKNRRKQARCEARAKAKYGSKAKSHKGGK